MGKNARDPDFDFDLSRTIRETALEDYHRRGIINNAGSRMSVSVERGTLITDVSAVAPGGGQAGGIPKLALAAAGVLAAAGAAGYVVKNKKKVGSYQTDDGRTLDILSDGSQTGTLADGTRFTVDSDGVIRMTQPDGVITTTYPDGRMVNLYPADSHGVIQTITYHPDGSRTAQIQGSDYQHTYLPDGTIQMHKPDGSINTFDSDYQPIGRQTPDGTSMMKQSDGTYAFSNKVDGSSGTMVVDGDNVSMNLIIQGQSGSYQSQALPDGSTQVNISGPDLNYQVNIQADGSATFDMRQGDYTASGTADAQGNQQMNITDAEGNTMTRNIGNDGSLNDQHTCGSYLKADASGDNLTGKIVDQNRTITFDANRFNVTLDNGLQKTIHAKQPDGSYTVDIQTPDGKTGTRTYSGDGSGSFQPNNPHNLFDSYNNAFSQ